MPYEIVTDAPGCDGFAVVKTAAGLVPGGCHLTKTEAEAHLTALNIAEFANETKASAMEEQTETRDGEGLYPLTPRQQKQYEDLEAVTELFGPFNTGIGEAGAHYVDAAANPFASEGLVCSNCAFYEGPRACEIVAGDIDPSAICKFWIIPESLTSGVMPVDIPAPDAMTETAPEEPAPVRYAAYPVEARRIAGRDVEFRTVEMGTLEAGDVNDEGFARSFTGYAAVFNSPSEPLPFVETIAPGAFKRSLNSGKEIRAFVNHNTDAPLATTKNGSLQLAEDERGLRVNMTLPDTTAGRDLSVLLRDGVVHSMSFGFTVPKAGDTWSADGSARTLKEIRLHEVSVVTGFPAYAATEGATVRTADNVTDTPEPGRSVDIARRYLELARKRK